MSLEESRKRKSPQRDISEENGLKVTEDDIDEPQSKIPKSDDLVEKTNSNLESGTSHEKHEKETLLTNEENMTKVDDTVENKISSTENLPFTISIQFKDESIANLYKSRFLKFINTFIELEVKTHDNLSINVIHDDSLNPKDWEVVDETLALESSMTEHDTTLDDSPNSNKKKRKKRSKAKKELFVVDATPSAQSESAGLRYTSKFVMNTEQTEGTSQLVSSRQTCFNCDKFHALKDCPDPKDFEKINAARMKFRQHPKTSRYHLEEDQKYSHLAPGKMSQELRKALGLPKNETPHFIYLMRRLGYPPGWLEDAKIVHSDLDMFDIHGNNVKTTEMKKAGLDLEKIIDFPGFNVPFEEGFVDDFRAYGVPPYSNDFSKEAMIEFFNNQFAKQEDNVETCAMDIAPEDSLINNKSPVKETPKNKTATEKLKGETVNRESPSLVDLEAQKQKLLEELDEEPTKSEEDDKNNQDTEDKKVDKAVIVKSSCFGTPILKSGSPYVKLPDPDNFSKDVSPVINFENLPNSTGKYEQMTDVLQKVRSTMKKIQNCNS